MIGLHTFEKGVKAYHNPVYHFALPERLGLFDNSGFEGSFLALPLEVEQGKQNLGGKTTQYLPLPYLVIICHRRPETSHG